jgi:CDP-diacylglycerol--glycerol-3-phosphate 3-phosphatidyltransferase
MVATALILLLQNHPTVIFAIASAIIIGREITISALREWMAELGESGLVKVTLFGKVKTGFQMTAISFLLYRDPIFGLPISLLGELLLYTAAALTLWSMYTYVVAAWPAMKSAGAIDSDQTDF